MRQPVKDEPVFVLVAPNRWIPARYACHVRGIEVVVVDTAVGPLPYKVARASLRTLAEAEKQGITGEPPEPDYTE